MRKVIPRIGVVCLASFALSSTPLLSRHTDASEVDPTLALPHLSVKGANAAPAISMVQGMPLVALAGDSAELASYNEFGAQARLGWNEQGIVAWIEVSDSTPFESDDIEHLYEGDSVALIVSGADPKDGQVEFVATAGTTPAQSTQRSIAVDHRTKAMRAKHGAATGTASMRRTKFGYVAQLLVPWSNFGGVAKLGDLFGVRVTINDRETQKSHRSRLIFVVPGTKYEFFDLPRFRLAEKAQGAPSAVAWVRYDEYVSSIRINVVADRRSIGKRVEVRQDDKLVASGKLASDGARAAVRLSAAAAAVGKKHGDITVRVDGKPLAVAPLADSEVERRRIFESGAREQGGFGAPPSAWTKPHFASEVFDGEAFPAFAYPEPERIRALVGEVTISVNHYDANGTKVDVAKSAGRYGAIVTIRSADGTTVVAHHTLFRRPTASDQTGDAVTLAARFEKFAGDPIKADRDWWHSLRKKLGTAVKYEYFVRTPAAYDKDKNKRWPTIVFLHGSGGGDKFEGVQTSGPQVPATARPNFPFIVLSLRSPGGWYPPAVKDVIDEVQGKYRTDLKRTYLAGFSMGGMGTWEVLFDQPQRFAAASPVGGRRGHPERAAEIKHVPLWVWNGAIDGTTTPTDAKAAVDALKAVGGNVKYTEIPDAGHTDSHDFVFHGTELYDWFLTQRLSP